MKHVLMTLVIALFGLSAQATSIMPHKTVLQISSEPINQTMPGGPQIEMGRKLEIGFDGRLVYSQLAWGGVTARRVVGQIDQNQVQKLSMLAWQARFGQMVLPNNGMMMCMAMPFKRTTVAAIDGGIVLQVGEYPCGQTTYNNTREAQILVRYIQTAAKKLNIGF